MKYTLYKNHLTKDENDCIARPVKPRVRNLDDLIGRLSGFTSILSSDEIKAIYNSYWDIIKKFVADGEEFYDGNIRIGIGMSGKFVDENDRFDKDRHEVTLHAILAAHVKEVSSSIEPEFVKQHVDIPTIAEVFDWTSQTENSKITSNGGVEIKGNDLKILNKSEEEGIYFIDINTYEEFKVNYLRTNQPKFLQFVAPNLKPGTYSIEIRNTSRKGSELRISFDDLNYIVQ
ncbi:MAG: DUF4469 domain-containing protein [Bacteroidales bacterium]